MYLCIDYMGKLDYLLIIRSKCSMTFFTRTRFFSYMKAYRVGQYLNGPCFVLFVRTVYLYSIIKNFLSFREWIFYFFPALFYVLLQAKQFQSTMICSFEFRSSNFMTVLVAFFSNQAENRFNYTYFPKINFILLT